MTVTVSTTLIHEVGIDYLSEIKMTVTVSTTQQHELAMMKRSGNRVSVRDVQGFVARKNVQE